MPALNPLQQVATHFENLTDPRLERTRRHILQDILVIAFCALIANANPWVDIERYGKTQRDLLRRFLELPHGIPSHDTFSRVFAKLDPAAGNPRRNRTHPRAKILVESGPTLSNLL